MKRHQWIAVCGMVCVLMTVVFADSLSEETDRVVFHADDPAGCDTVVRGGMLKTCANLEANARWNGNPGDIILGSAPNGVPARLRTCLPSGQCVPMIHTSRDGVTQLGQPAVWLLNPNESIVLNQRTAGILVLGTSGGTALYRVDCGDGIVELALPDLKQLFGATRGAAPLSLYYEPHPTVLSCVLTNTSSEARKVGVNNLGGG